MKPEVVFICQYKLGGVQNYYYNLLSANAFEGFDKRLIYINNEDDHETKLPKPFGIIKDETVFRYSEKDGAYFTFRRLSKLVSNRPGFVFTNFPAELGALHNNPVDKTVAYVVHDEWYIQNAIRYGFLIDVYIAHNSGIFATLQQLLPDRKEDIYYLPYGIQPSAKARLPNPQAPLKIIFTGRLHEMKGIFDLPLIDDILRDKGITCSWTIIGNGPEREKFLSLTADRGNFSFHTPDTTAEVLDITSRQDVFILPSRLEGMPVSLLEAMSAALVPLIANFNEGIHSVVTKDIGWIFKAGDVASFADAIVFLHENREMLDEMGKNAREKVLSEFDAGKRAAAYHELIKNYSLLKSSRKNPLPVKYGNGRLDRPFIPDWMVKTLRSIRKRLNG